MKFYLIAVAAAAIFGAPAAAQTEFRDCSVCPTMVEIPRGSFIMGSPANEAGRTKNEGPQHRVTIAYPLAIAKHEVTFAEWDACVAEGACRRHTDDQGDGREQRPATSVNWFDAQAYAQWLAQKTGHHYRLLSAAEWEYGARAGTATAFWWGKAASHEYANYGTDDCCEAKVEGRDQWIKAAPVESFPANAFGLHDMLGNVWEWTEDCWAEDYARTPKDGSANRVGDCDRHVMRGGSFGSMPIRIRAAFYDGYPPDDHGDFIGFRVARGE